jgi:hypothetical protein
MTMNHRTTFSITPSENKIKYSTPVMFIGSCFATEIGSVMGEGKMKVLINPSGVVYNPVSIANTIDFICEKREFIEKDLYVYKGINLSLLHSTDFESDDADLLLKKINSVIAESNSFLKSARFLFVTFGTSRIYRLKESGKIVSNCHKLPGEMFSNELLEKGDIIKKWTDTLDSLSAFNNDLKVIFTISPVRHWKDGAHGNQISKSLLFLAVEELLDNPAVEGYFPAYELLMDDLRDYRYYANDMLHPSEMAIDYIWNAFANCYLTAETSDLWKEVLGITKAGNHRFLTDSLKGKKEFAKNILKKISQIEAKLPGIDLVNEKSYFLRLMDT